MSGPGTTLFGGDTQKSAIDIFAAQKQCEQQRKELRQLISYTYGNDAWLEFQAIERRVREQQREQVYRRRELIEGIVEAALWTGIILATSVIAGFGLYFWGRYAVREKAVARGANGRYYAVVRYHD